MSRILEVNGFQATVDYDPEVECFRGEFLGLRGGAEFYAPTWETLPREAERSLAIFLKLCEQDGINPRREFNGRLNLDLAPDLHERLALTAEASGKSLQEWLRDILEGIVAEQKNA